MAEPKQYDAPPACIDGAVWDLLCQRRNLHATTIAADNAVRDAERALAAAKDALRLSRCVDVKVKALQEWAATRISPDELTDHHRYVLEMPPHGKTGACNG